MADEQKEIRSGKNRIKNITDEVHPEGKHVASSGKKKTVKSSAISKTQKKAAGASSENAMKKNKKSKKKNKGFAAAICAVLAVLLIAGGLILFVMNYKSASSYDDKGMTAYESGDYEEAIKNFKEAISYDTDNASYYIHLGMAYIGQQSYDEAIGYLNQASSCAEEDFDKILAARGQGIAYLYHGSYDDAVNAFDSALSYNGGSLTSDLKKDILCYEAEAYENEEDYDNVVGVYTSILKIDSDDAQILMKRGLAEEKQGDYTSAEKDLRQAIKKSKKNYTIYMALYDSLKNQGKTDEAQEALNDALSIEGNSGQDYYFKGMIYTKLGDKTNAMDSFQKAYTKGYMAALIGEGQVCAAEEDYKNACAYYEKYFSNADGSDTELLANAYNQYAAALIKLERYEDAVKACESGLDLNCRDTDAALSFNLIAAYEGEEDWSKAYSAAKSYHEKYPADENGTHEFEFLESRMSE